MLQNPEDERNIVVIGVNVKCIAADFNELEKKFPSFKITLEESDDDVYTEELACKVEKRESSGIRETGWFQTNVATIEMLVTAEHLSSADERAEDPVYAVVPAHLVLDKNLRTLCQKNYNELREEYRESVEARRPA